MTETYSHPLYHWPNKGRWNHIPVRGRRWGAYAAYVHFPFCRSICDFCGYETRLLSKPAANDFPEKVGLELERLRETDDFSTATTKSVFFGGGTASLMRAEAITALVSQLGALAPMVAQAEVTLECEPGTISTARLAEVKAGGVNRISVCAQSLDDGTLSSLNRRHTTKDSISLVEDCLTAGFENLHLDLMYGLPGQTRAAWRDCLLRAVEMPFVHISTYKFYTYRHGAYHRKGFSDPFQRISDEALSDARWMLHDAQEILTRAGFHQYSLTEFCRPGRKSAYVTSCFAGDDVLPVGPSAFGRCGVQVWDNSPYVHLYGSPESDKHDRGIVLSRIQAFKRDTILGLWLLNVPVFQLANKYGVTLSEELLKLFEDLDKAGLLSFDGAWLRIGPDQIFDVGAAMKILSDLQESSWASETHESDPPDSNSNIRFDVGYRSATPEMNTILRMARRDPSFFLALSASPSDALRGVQHSLSDHEISALVGAILNNSQDGDEYGIHIREEWKRVQRENLGRVDDP